MTANPHRGEVEVELGGKAVLLRPSFAALVDVEKRLGIDLIPLAARFRLRQIGIRHVSTIIHACWASADRPEPEKVGELVLSSGIVDLIDPLIELLANALTGGSKNAAAPAEQAGAKN